MPEPVLDDAAGLRAANARLRGLLAERDAEIAALRAGLEASLERERGLELRLAELERLLSMDSTDSGTPSSKERTGAKEARRARQQSERERRKDRKRGGQPGHQGKGPQRDPDPDEKKAAGSPAECRRCKAGLDGAQAVEPRWAQVIDAVVIQKVTEWALPGLVCPCCGRVTFAEAPPGAHAGSVSYGPVLNAAAVLLACYGNVPPERAALVVGMLLGVPVSAGWVDKAAARVSAQLERAGFNAAMIAALTAEDVLAADETPVNVLDRDTMPPAAPEGERGEGRQGRGGRRAARADRPHPRRAADLPAGHRLPPQGRHRRRAPGPVHRGADHRRLRRLPAPPGPAGRHPAMLCPRDQEMPRGHETRPGRPAVLGWRHHRDPARGAPGRRGGPRPRGHRPGPAAAEGPAGTLRQGCRCRIIHNRLRDWHAGNHPGYALGCWLRDYKEQVFLFTRDFNVDWTNNVSERGAKAAKRHQAVSGYWHSLATLTRWCRIRSYLDSAAAHGITPLDAIRDALARNPWLPPLPAIT